jgi:hypothetical protein
MKKYYLFLTLLLLSGLRMQAQNFVHADSLVKGAYGTAAWGDYDGDGKKDLVYITQTLLPNAPNIFNVYHNVAGNLVQVAQTFPSLALPAAVWGDLDNDGKEDLIVSGMGDSSDVLLIYKSNGDGTFTLKNDTLHKLNTGSIAITDYNNDGLKDIAACGFAADLGFSSGTFIFKNQGNFVFKDIHSPLAGIYRGDIKWFDYDQDGKADLSYNGVTNDNNARVFIYHNDGNDSFHQVNGYMRGAIDATVDWFDYNGDGKKDLVTAGVDSNGASNFTDLYKNNGDGTFSLVASNIAAFGEPVAAEVADFNGDGKADLCLVGGSILLPDMGAVFFNTGSATLGIQTLPITNTDLITNCIVAAADIDNDGDQDLLLGNYILKNTGIVGITDMELEKVTVYPNPAGTFFVVNNPLDVLQISLVDISGKTMLSKTLKKGVHRIEISSCASGVYRLLLASGTGGKLVKPIVVYR